MHVVRYNLGTLKTERVEKRLEQGELAVVLLEKVGDGLREIEVRNWSANMVAALDHVNYIVVGGKEYETVEGRLNLDTNRLELLLVAMRA
ncbi:hypothetical protein ACU063_13085 [Paenibacillus sp. M.A.Huq-81]